MFYKSYRQRRPPTMRSTTSSSIFPFGGVRFSFPPLTRLLKVAMFSQIREYTGLFAPFFEPTKCFLKRFVIFDSYLCHFLPPFQSLEDGCRGSTDRYSTPTPLYVWSDYNRNVILLKYNGLDQMCQEIRLLYHIFSVFINIVVICNTLYLFVNKFISS